MKVKKIIELGEYFGMEHIRENNLIPDSVFFNVYGNMRIGIKKDSKNEFIYEAFASALIEKGKRIKEDEIKNALNI